MTQFTLKDEARDHLIIGGRREGRLKDTVRDEIYEKDTRKLSASTYTLANEVVIVPSAFHYAGNKSYTPAKHAPSEPTIDANLAETVPESNDEIRQASANTAHNESYDVDEQGANRVIYEYDNFEKIKVTERVSGETIVYTAAEIRLVTEDDESLTGDAAQAEFDTTPIAPIVGTKGNDTLSGDAKSNILIGKGGDDILQGGEGQDTLYGGSGHNSLYGGRKGQDGDEASDVFVLYQGFVLSGDSYTSVIYDFEHGVDKIGVGREFKEKYLRFEVRNEDDTVIYHTRETEHTGDDVVLAEIIGYQLDPNDDNNFDFSKLNNPVRGDLHARGSAVSYSANGEIDANYYWAGEKIILDATELDDDDGIPDLSEFEFTWLNVGENGDVETAGVGAVLNTSVDDHGEYFIGVAVYTDDLGNDEYTLTPYIEVF